jgi:predicted hydrocarbon binding protein
MSILSEEAIRMSNERTLGGSVAVEAFQLFRLLGFTSLAESLGAVGEERDQMEYLAGTAIGRSLVRQERVQGENLSQLLDSFKQFYKQMELGLIYSELCNSGEIVVGIEECAGCHGTELAHRAVCYVEAGMICGMVSEFTGEDYAAREVKCIGGLGDTACEFVLAK